MSIDFKIQNNCDHTINWERVALSADRRYVSPTYPIGAVVSLALRINGVVVDPSTYNTYLNPEDQVLSPKSIIKFKKVCPLYYPLIEVLYTTYKSYCPKCVGTGIIDDYVYSPSKDVLTVKDEFLLIQTLEKLIITKINSNKYYSWIGTTLHTLIGKKITDLDYFKTKITEDVRKSVDDLKKIQNQYACTNLNISRLRWKTSSLQETISSN
jgi:hypothetical protein